MSASATQDHERLRNRPVGAFPQTTLRVVLSTLGKFHTFDLARQLHRHNALTAIFSGYPSFKLKQERLPESLVRTFPYLHAPYMKVGPTYTPLKRFWERQDRWWLDRHVKSNLPPCDVFCGLSGSALQTGELAKRRGARYVCDRGSSHIRFQDDILRREYDQQTLPYTGIDPWIIQREEAEYAAADVITVPSQFALDSFVRYGVPRQKLRLVPYGVDLDLFHPVGSPATDDFRILFVGALSVRKGIPYLLRAFQQLQHPRKHLTLIGGLAPELSPFVSKHFNRGDISIMGTLPQAHLKEHMSRSHVMVLPSVEEGLALVQAQAMACGCPLVSSTNTGASDLFSDGVEGFIVPAGDSTTIAERLQRLADNPDLQQEMSNAALRRVQSVSGWDEYGKNMFALFSGLREGS